VRPRPQRESLLNRAEGLGVLFAGLEDQLRRLPADFTAGEPRGLFVGIARPVYQGPELPHQGVLGLVGLGGTDEAAGCRRFGDGPANEVVRVPAALGDGACRILVHPVSLAQLVDLLHDAPADEDIAFFVEARDQAVQRRANDPSRYRGLTPEAPETTG
jgi:hypothetical protein